MMGGMMGGMGGMMGGMGGGGCCKLQSFFQSSIITF
jgi:hypothetical protein